MRITAQCLPSNVTAQLDCNVNTAAIHWDPSPNNPDSYTALAISTDGTRVSCNTSSTSCTIKSLRCGQTYSIAVTTSQINCGIIEGSDYHIETGKLTIINGNNPKPIPTQKKLNYCSPLSFVSHQPPANHRTHFFNFSAALILLQSHGTIMERISWTRWLRSTLAVMRRCATAELDLAHSHSFAVESRTRSVWLEPMETAPVSPARTSVLTQVRHSCTQVRDTLTWDWYSW